MQGLKNAIIISMFLVGAKYKIALRIFKKFSVYINKGAINESKHNHTSGLGEFQARY
ncbi:hypothetical protein KH0195_13510 [Helicobacter pylori]